jgi:hypothetical protein
MNENNTNVNQETENTEIDYISAINELKANSVDREKYMKLKDENQRLLNTLVSGGQIEVPTEEKVDINQLRKELYSDGGNLSNLDYWTKTMKLREALMDAGKPDPFIPQGKNIVATDSDRAAAQKVADGIQHCIDVADGDSSIFTNELQRITVDTIPTRRRK